MARTAGGQHPQPKEIIFSDLAVSLRAHPVTKKPVVLKNADAIKRAIKNLILTNKYERPYEPDFGGNILDMLFENFDPLLEERMRGRIERTIGNFEPRVTINNITVNANEDQNELIVSIAFTPQNSMRQEELTVELQRTR